MKADPVNERCSTCPRGLSGLIPRKLGACPLCMRLSLAGALLASSGTIALALSAAPPPVVVGGAAVAVAFVSLFAAHVVALAWRLGATLRRQRQLGGPAAALADQLAGRRRFIRFAVKAAVATLIGSFAGVGTQRGTLVVHASSCEGEHQTKDESGAKRGPITVCDGRDEDGGRIGAKILDLEGFLFAWDFCRQFGCPPGSICAPLITHSVGGCTRVEGKCPGGGQAWECDHTVIDVTCGCVYRAAPLTPAEYDEFVHNKVEEQLKDLRKKGHVK